MKRVSTVLALILAAVGVVFLAWDAYARHRYIDVAFACVCEWLLLSAIWSKS